MVDLHLAALMRKEPLVSDRFKCCVEERELDPDPVPRRIPTTMCLIWEPIDRHIFSASYTQGLSLWIGRLGL